MSIAFNGKGMASLMFNGKLAAQIFFGAKLIWQKIQKLLEYDFGGGQNNCYEIVPIEDISLSSISAFAKYNNASDMTVRIINECGILIANSSQNGVASKADLYNLTGDDGGFMNTVSSLGTVTLFKGNKYYINVQKGGTGGWNLARYVGETGNYKSYSNTNQMALLSDAGARKCYGTCSNFSELAANVRPNGYFKWTGGSMGESMKPNNGDSQHPYAFLLKRDMSKVKHVFTASEFGDVGGNDIKKYAYIFYTMGQTEGDEFIMNAGSYWGGGFRIDPDDWNTTYFTNNQYKIYKLTGNMSKNHITSMTPIDEEPSNPEYGAVYYKSNSRTWGSISAEAVVAWTGSWVIATNVSAEWTADDEYDATNYCEMIYPNNGWTIDAFNSTEVQQGSKWYFKANNIEV